MLTINRRRHFQNVKILWYGGKWMLIVFRPSHHWHKLYCVCVPATSVPVLVTLSISSLDTFNVNMQDRVIVTTDRKQRLVGLCVSYRTTWYPMTLNDLEKSFSMPRAARRLMSQKIGMPLVNLACKNRNVARIVQVNLHAKTLSTIVHWFLPTVLTGALNATVLRPSGWWRGLAVTRWSRSTKLLYAGPGQYLDGWLCASG